MQPPFPSDAPFALTTYRSAAAPWPCLRAARAQAQARQALLLRGAQGVVQVGSVDVAHLPLLLAQWPAQWLALPTGLCLRTPPEARTAVLAEMGLALRAQGLIQAWRDEPYALWDERGQSQAVIERATARFWGALTLGAHCNGYVADPTGQPTHLWIARRALNKPTDPGRLDNLIGGGVPQGQTPHQALLREAWEEAGLQPQHLAGLQRGGVLALRCDIPEGLQHEWLYVYDLALPPTLQPRNQDGEVAEHRLLPTAEALALAACGAMTVDAALATLDFGLRHRLIEAQQAHGLTRALAALRVPATLARQFDDPDSPR